MLQPTDLESLVPEDHRVRSIWAFVEALDVSAFEAEIDARGSEPGRPAIDPRVLLTLWLFATSEGVGSARLLATLCSRDAPYRWICGGVSVSHKTVSDFRTKHAKKVDDLLTQVLATLMKHGIVKLNRVAHDGMRVRASAGAASFRRKTKLRQCLDDAREQVTRLRKELTEDPTASTNRERSARERAARERQNKVQAALAEMQKAEEARAREARRSPSRLSKRGEVRVSTTDPECRVMKMADGGYRPAYNVQLATDASGDCIVGVMVTNHGNDQPHVEPMLDDIKRRTHETPREYLVDGGFASLRNIEVLSSRGARPYAPVPNRLENPHKPQPNDPPAVGRWRRRMGKESAKRIYAQRAAVAERVNADLRVHRGLDRFTVRGLAKVNAVVLIAALTFNVLRAISVGVSP
jgi:transposase